MAAMCAFANGEPAEPFVHPVIRAMILHFWLAYDHPFVDGNGRTARALFYWAMLRADYWLFEFISISEVLRRAPVKYYRAFLHTETDDNDLTYFLLHQSDVIRQAIGRLHGYITRKTKEVGESQRMLRNWRHLNHRQQAIIGHALRHTGASYTVEGHQRSHDTSYNTARTDMLDLLPKACWTRPRAASAWCSIRRPAWNKPFGTVVPRAWIDCHLFPSACKNLPNPPVSSPPHPDPP